MLIEMLGEYFITFVSTDFAYIFFTAIFKRRSVTFVLPHNQLNTNLVQFASKINL